MPYSFSPEYLFTKGIAFAEFYDPVTGSLLGFSEYVTDFAVKGSVNTGEVSGGPGNMLVMCIPDTARLSITARVADSALQNMALTVGTGVQASGTAQVTAAVQASTAQLLLPDAAPTDPGGTAFAYLTGSTGTDSAALRAQSGTAYTVEDGVVQGFTALPGTTYFVRYTRAVAGGSFSIPALFAPRVVRAHFAVNVYAKKRGCDLLASSLVMRRHYHIPCYCFTGALADSLSQTETGSVDLSGLCLTSEGPDGTLSYGTVVDEPIDGGSAAGIGG